MGALISDFSMDMTLVVIQSLSAGTFVYLACCDLIVHAFHKAKNDSLAHKLCKLGTLILGSVFVIALMQAFPEPEGAH